MKRGSLAAKDAMQGFGFKEGILLIEKSVVAVHQFPPNSQTKEQSDPFTCMRWTGTKLDKDLNVIEDQEPVTLPLRICGVGVGQPGNLKEKDWDDMDAVPKALGTEVDTEGNCLVLEDDGRAEGNGWAKMEASLLDKGFKEGIASKGIATLYEGMIVALKTVEGDKYIAKRGAKKGQEVTSSNLVADRIYRFPYDKSGKVKVGGDTDAPASKKANGAAEKDEDGGGGGKVHDKAVAVFENATAKFKAAVFTGKATDRKKFQKELVSELMRQDVDDTLQTEIMALVKDGASLKALGKEVGFKVGEDSVTFAEAD